MPLGDSTRLGGNARAFPSTQWNLLRSFHSCSPSELPDLLNVVVVKYWKPLYCYIRKRGWQREDAKDLVQAFFLKALEQNLFAKADSARAIIVITRFFPFRIPASASRASDAYR